MTAFADDGARPFAAVCAGAVVAFAGELAAAEKVAALTIAFGDRQLRAARSFGVSDTARYPLTSLTKPMVAATLLRLVETGEVTLADRVCRFRESFANGGKRSVTLGQAIDHTAGLPMTTDDDTELRRAGAGLSDFLASADACSLLQPPGREASYSNVGYLLVGDIIERVCGEPLPMAMNRLLFDPLGMTTASLGLIDDIDRVLVSLPSTMRDEPWHWNSRYWSGLAAPWGGAFGTAADVARFATAVGQRLTPPPVGRQDKSWWRGFRRTWPDHTARFGDLISPNAIGHFGASGNLMWVDGDRWLVALSSEPIGTQPRLLQRLSNVAAHQLSRIGRHADVAKDTGSGGGV